MTGRNPLRRGVAMKASDGNVHCSCPVPMRHRLRSVLLLAVLAMVACMTPAWAQQRNDAPQTYSIAAGKLADALDQLARQSKVQIIYPSNLVSGKRAPTVSG